MGTYEKAGGGQRPRVYLDTNLVSGIRKEDLGAEQQALRRILAAHKTGTIALVTSRITHEEIQGLPLGMREAHEDIHALLSDVPLADEEFLMPQVVRAGPGLKGPLPVAHEILGKLRSILPDENDARHLFHAISNDVEYFVTYDKATILKHAAAVEREFPIRVLSPSQLANELGL